MNILFKGQIIHNGEWIESDSILQGVKAGKKRIFLKHRETFPKWIECHTETVNQIITQTK